jgi:hypothetical protein
LPTSPTSAGAPPQGATATVQVSANPNPVPFSGAPIQTRRSAPTTLNTWFYDTVLLETGGGGNDVYRGSTCSTARRQTAHGPEDPPALRYGGAPHAVVQRGVHDTRAPIFGGLDDNGNAVTATGQVAGTAKAK